MSGLVSEQTVRLARRTVSGSRPAARIALFFALALGLGAAAGVVWWAVVDLPNYLVNSEGGAAINERGLAEFIASDAWFSMIGLVVGLGLGILGWRSFGRLGWPVVPLLLISAIAAEVARRAPDGRLRLVVRPTDSSYNVVVWSGHGEPQAYTEPDPDVFKRLPDSQEPDR